MWCSNNLHVGHGPSSDWGYEYMYCHVNVLVNYIQDYRVTGVNGLFCLLNENITFFYSVTVYISIKYKRRVFLTIDEPFEPYEPLEPVEPRQRAEPLGLRTSEYPNFWLHGIVRERRTLGHLFFWTDYILCWSILFISLLIISCLNFLKKNYIQIRIRYIYNTIFNQE